MKYLSVSNECKKLITIFSFSLLGDELFNWIMFFQSDFFLFLKSNEFLERKWFDETFFFEIILEYHNQNDWNSGNLLWWWIFCNWNMFTDDLNECIGNWVSLKYIEKWVLGTYSTKRENKKISFCLKTREITLFQFKMLSWWIIYLST